MNINISSIETGKNYPPIISADEEIYYPDTDETIMPEGIQHFLLSVRLISTLLAFFAKHEAVNVFGNCMLYYEEGNPRKVVSPDLMVCFGLQRVPARVYKLWEEKITPSVVVELASETTWLNDVSTKLALYQKLGIKEYYVFDVERGNLPESLLAYRLIDDELTQIEVADKRIFSESLKLELVDTGETLRFFDPQVGEFLLTTEEMAEKLSELKKRNDGN